MLVVVCGVPGVGKTTVAEYVADRVDGELHRTDVVRKDLHPDPEYTAEETQRVYDEVLRRGRETVADGTPAVLDGTFKKRPLRRRAMTLAKRVDADLEFVKVECDDGVVRERIAARENDESDADYEVHAMFKAQFDALEYEHVTVDNSDGLAATRRQVERHF